MVTVQLTATKATESQHPLILACPSYWCHERPLKVFDSVRPCSIHWWNKLVSLALVTVNRPWIRSMRRSEIWSRSQGKYDWGCAPGSWENISSEFFNLWSSFLHRLWNANVIRFVSRLGFTAHQVSFPSISSSGLALSLPPFAGLDILLPSRYIALI